MIIAMYHGYPVVRVIEYLPDGKVRLDQKTLGGGTITVNADPDEVKIYDLE